MSENKTQPTDVDPRTFVTAVEHPVRRADAELLLDLFGRVTGWQARMWGPTIATLFCRRPIRLSPSR
jgi:hypothetical protein